MGMFDWYEPEAAHACPECDAELSGWQGTSGPCALLVYRQGRRYPVDQRVDPEARLLALRQAAFDLPAAFQIHTFCANGHPAALQCGCDDHRWVSCVPSALR
ncbi:MAG: hypothetical protein QM711_13630 [Micropruina sp.]|uniref:hypothetical protein n=1 Tax=Micropruina sp. TaxID=2737536 RepID=UPI0039E3D4ED